MHDHWLKHLWFLRDAEPGCLVQVATRTEPRLYAPGELPERNHMYVIQRGVVLYAARVLTTGKMWGFDIILESEGHVLMHVRAPIAGPPPHTYSPLASWPLCTDDFLGVRAHRSRAR